MKQEELLKYFELKEDPEPTLEFMYLDKTGCSWKSLEDYVLTEILGFCGCGTPTEIGLKYVLPFLEKLESGECGEYEDYEYMFLVYWANDRNLADHGTTARCSWLNEKGKKVLEVLKQIKLD